MARTQAGEVTRDQFVAAREAQRVAVRVAREAVDKGDTATAVAKLAEIVAYEHAPAGVPMDVRMRYWEVIGALETAGMTQREAMRQIAAIAGRVLEEEE